MRRDPGPFAQAWLCRGSKVSFRERERFLLLVESQRHKPGSRVHPDKALCCVKVHRLVWSAVGAAEHTFAWRTKKPGGTRLVGHW